MKNDIDSILDALFSGGKLNVGSGTKSRAAKDAEDFLNSIEKTNANMQSSLNRQISDLDKLTSDAQRSMDEMRRLLDAEGLTGTPEMEAPKAETAEKKPKAKGAEEPPQDPAQSFREAREATGRTVIGQDAFLDDNTLTVNVARLRSHLEEIGLGGLVRTQKGVGYLVEEQT